MNERKFLDELRTQWRAARVESEKNGGGMAGVMVYVGLLGWIDDQLHADDLEVASTDETETIKVLRDFCAETENQAIDAPPPRGQFESGGWEENWPALYAIYWRAKKLLVQIDEREERESGIEDDETYE